MPTPTEHLTTGDAYIDLTRFACPTSSSYRFKLIPGTCPPWLPDGGGSLGIASPCPRGAQFGCYPRYCRTEPGPSHRGQEGQQEPFCSRVRSAALPIPRSRHYCLSVALWDGFRCSAYGAARPAENLRPGGGQVRRSCTPAMVDVQPGANEPGYG